VYALDRPNLLGSAEEGEMQTRSESIVRVRRQRSIEH
jgi:hypothetical protein